MFIEYWNFMKWYKTRLVVSVWIYKKLVSICHIVHKSAVFYKIKLSIENHGLGILALEPMSHQHTFASRSLTS